MKRFSLFVVLFSAFLLVSCNKSSGDGEDGRYVLEEEVVFSRHNIRSPLSTPDSELSKVISQDYAWTDWGVPTAHLTERGARIERKMGEWFYGYSNSLAPIDETNALIYSNSKQRTIKTAENFITGFNAELPLLHLYDDDSMDPLFFPAYPTMNDNLKSRIYDDMNAIGGMPGTAENPLMGVNAAVNAIIDNIHFMEDVIGFKDSPYAAQNGVEHLPSDVASIILNAQEEPAMTGGYKLINSIADAVVLQYYETGTAFGKYISLEDIRKVGKVKTVYDEVLFANRTTAVIVSNKLVRYIRDELCRTDRKFTFLCGHDSNIASISTALGLKFPETQNAVEFTSPIGSKIVFRKYRRDDSEFIDVKLIYASVQQLREELPIDVNNSPVILPLEFEGLSKNADGYYTLKDVITRFDETIAEYDVIMGK